jgi:hypothetical protein
VIDFWGKGFDLIERMGLQHARCASWTRTAGGPVASRRTQW